MPLSRNRGRLLARLRDRKGRRREARVLVEGPRAVRTAFDAGTPFDFVVAAGGTEGAGLLSDLARAGVEVVTLPPDEVDALADTESPQGILAVVREPDPALPDDPSPRRVLALDRIQDPGNAGTLIRAAAGLGVDLVISLDGSVDPWNPKVVRASAGEAFRIPVVRTDWEAFATWSQAHALPLLVADAAGRDVRSAEPDLPARWVLLVGNEGSGSRDEALAAARSLVSVPLSTGVESLNAAVAGSLLLWALGPGREDPPHSPETRSTDPRD